MTDVVVTSALQGDQASTPIQPAAEPAPAVASEVAPAAPALVDYSVGGQTFKVPAELAYALSQQQQPQPMAPAAPQAQAPDELERLWYTNPTEAARVLTDRVEQRMTQRYQAVENEKQIWADFHKANPDLTGVPREYIASIVRGNGALLHGLNPQDGLKRVGELVRENMLAFARGLQQTNQQSVPALVSGNSPTPQATQAAEPTQGEPDSLSAIIKARRAQRRSVESRQGAPAPQH